MTSFWNDIRVLRGVTSTKGIPYDHLHDKHYRARITKRIDLAPELWMIRIDPGAEFKFTPGQYATLGIEGEEKRSERPYSIVSSPYENEIEFFFELVPHGELTPQIYALQTGDELLMRKASQGRFVLDTAADGESFAGLHGDRSRALCEFRAHPCIKTGRKASSQGEHKLFLLNGASRSWEFGYVEELQKYARKYRGCSMCPPSAVPGRIQTGQAKSGASMN